MKILFDNTTLGKHTLKNRVWRSATWMALADAEGNVTEELVNAYEELAGGRRHSVEVRVVQHLLPHPRPSVHFQPKKQTVSTTILA